MPALPWEIGHHFEKGLRLDGSARKELFMAMDDNNDGTLSVAWPK